MKRKLLLSLSGALLSVSLMAGGIMTNTNQSASYVRMLARNASLGIDGVYYNPAGLTKLGNGFYLSFNNQSIFQVKDVTNNYKYLNGHPDAKYTGDIKAPVFPGVYAAYKMNKFAFSFGFNPVGGGGGAKYDKGLPSFEMPISDLVPSLSKSSTGGVNAYKADINFEGTSIYFGYQVGVSYKINDMISVFGGLRYVTAKNTYKGSIANIMINPTGIVATNTYTGVFMRADLFGSQIKPYYTAVAAQLSGVATSLQPIITGGGATYTLAQLEGAGLISSAVRAQIEGGLQNLGLTPQQIALMNTKQVQGAFSSGADGATQLTQLSAKTGDKEVDVIQKGTGYTPIIGANITLAEKLTIAIKYEFLTKIELTNETKIDGTNTFTDGAKSRADMPAMLSIGASYPVTSKLTASLGFNYYFDKNADYGKKDTLGAYVTNESVIDKNYYEIALGLEYNITDKFLVSAGFLHSQTGVMKSYQTDLSYSLTSNTVGFGGQYKITPGIGLNLGALITMYNKDDKTFNHKLGTAYIPTTEVYEKSNWVLSVGLDIKIGK